MNTCDWLSGCREGVTWLSHVQSQEHDYTERNYYLTYDLKSYLALFVASRSTLINLWTEKCWVAELFDFG